MPTAQVNGAEIYYEESGSGPPIILSGGGLQGTLAGYGPVVGELSREHRVISYDILCICYAVYEYISRC